MLDLFIDYVYINYFKIFLYIISNIIILFFLHFLAIKFKILDYPNDRKNHKGNIPLIGGLFIFSSLCLIAPFIKFDYWLLVILLSSIIVLFSGFLDDKYQIGIIPRLLAQLIATVIVIGSGISIVSIGTYFDYQINLGIYSIFFTIICVVGLTNAINFIDGVDGLSSSIALVSLFFIGFFSYMESTFDNHELLIYLFISLLIFLFSNFNLLLPKSFLGDAGSMLVGFLIGWFLIFYSHPDNNYFHPVLCIWIVTLPVYDLLSVFIRRVYKKTNPFKPDRRHIHHLLISYGLSHKFVLMIIIIFSICTSSFGYLIFKLYGSTASLFMFFFLLIIYLLTVVLLGRNIRNFL